LSGVEKKLRTAARARVLHLINTPSPRPSTSQGFPLAGLDLHAIREDRHRVIVLSNDHKALTKRIDAVLQDLHAAAKAAGVSGGGGGGGGGPAAAVAVPSTTASAHRPRPAPVPATAAVLAATSAGGAMGFAVVDEVADGSPAAAAGLALGDRVLRLGDATALAAVPAAVADAAEGGGRLAVSVLRAGAVVDLELAPRHGWGGRGVLGCHLRPV
jgi:26S proteasome regulatory subunit N4